MKDIHYRASLSFLRLTKKQAEAKECLQSLIIMSKLNTLEEDLSIAYEHDDTPSLIKTSKELITLGETLLQNYELNV